MPRSTPCEHYGLRTAAPSTNGNVLGGGQPVPTGPSFVDSTNVDAVAKYAARGTR